jgi:hypothetical protein
MQRSFRAVVRRAPALVIAATTVIAGTGAAAVAAVNRSAPPVHIEVRAPHRGDLAGIAGAAWMVDLNLEMEARSLPEAGFTAAQLSGPAGHNNIAPLPGTFSTGPDDRLPGLVVLLSTTNSTRPGFSGPGTNLANLFNLTGVTNRDDDELEIADTWLVGADIAGRDVRATLTVAVIDDLNGDGILNDAPAVVTDRTGDGQIDSRDVRAIGVASNVVTVPFRINGAPATAPIG